MPRTRRYIFITLTVVSVVLLLGAVGLFVRLGHCFILAYRALKS